MSDGSIITIITIINYSFNIHADVIVLTELIFNLNDSVINMGL